MRTKSLSDADKMRSMRAAGMTLEVIAAVFSKSHATVSYHVNPAYRERQKAKNNARQKAKRRAHSLKRAGFQATQAVPDAPVYDGGPVWIEDRTINLYGVGSCEQREYVRRIRATGSAASTKRPENRPETGPRLAPTHYVPAPIRAWVAYQAGDVNAIADYLRSIGRH